MSSFLIDVKPIKVAALFTLLVLITAGCTEKSETRSAQHDASETGNRDVILAEHNIRLGMTMPEDGRTLVGVIDFSALPAGGIRLGYANSQCICICSDTGNNTCTPAGCPDTCPVDFCSDGTFPPCPDSAPVLPDLKGLLSQPIDPDRPLRN